MLELVRESPWIATGLVALLAVIAMVAVHHVVRALLTRATRDAPLFRTVLRFTESAAGAVLPLAALQLVWTGAPDDLAYIERVRHFNALLLIAALTWLAARLISGTGAGVVATHPVVTDDNVQARRIQTQAKVLSRSAIVVVVIAGMAMALMTFPGARQVGTSLLASAGVIGIIGGLAARPLFSNLIAGLQLALAQPLRLDDVLIVKGEWGRVEEITGTYVVLKIWDERRMIVPLQWFIENPFENWTRQTSQLLGTVFLSLDFTMPMEPLRAELKRIVESAPEWDGRVCALQVTDATERTMQVRVLVSAASSGKLFDLRCIVREALLAYLALHHRECLPRDRWQAQGPSAGSGT